MASDYVYPVLAFHEMAARLALAGLCGAIVGAEREWRDRTAGFRTHILVCVGSTVFMLVSQYGFGHFVENIHGDLRPNVMIDPQRTAAQIVTGIGFLGAGAIFQSRSSVKGLTTAASLWAMAAIGMAVGTGQYALALTCTAMLIFVLTGLRTVSRRLKRLHTTERASVQLALSSDQTMSTVFDSLHSWKADITHVRTSLAEDESYRRVLRMEVDLPMGAPPTALVTRLAEVEGVSDVTMIDVERA